MEIDPSKALIDTVVQLSILTALGAVLSAPVWPWRKSLGPRDTARRATALGILSITFGVGGQYYSQKLALQYAPLIFIVSVILFTPVLWLAGYLFGRLFFTYASDSAVRSPSVSQSASSSLQESQSPANAEDVYFNPAHRNAPASADAASESHFPAGWANVVKYRPDVEPLIDELRRFGAEREFAIAVETLDSSAMSLDALTALKDSVIARMRREVYPFSDFELNDWHRILWVRHPPSAGHLREIVRTAGETVDRDRLIIDIVQSVNTSLRRLRKGPMKDIISEFDMVRLWSKAMNKKAMHKDVYHALIVLADLSGFAQNHDLQEILPSLDDPESRTVTIMAVARRMLLDTVTG